MLWHDYESWGADPKKDIPCQFAAIRTDLNLNIVGEPINWMARIPNDYLPHPQACAITGITPQQSLQKGMLESEFVNKIHEQMSQPNTCVVGYNNIRFDDEMTRFSFYRNFHDPYAREWQNGNSRWDLIDLVRTCYALRPEGINWVYNEEDVPSFKLELLSEANNISHEAAHDALSDVYATIGIAKLIKEKQPKLYDYYFSMRDKKQVMSMLKLGSHQPVVHISSKIPAAQGCCTWVLPICVHPSNKNAVIAVDLSKDSSDLLTLSIEDIQDKMYKKSSELAPGEQRIPLKLIHVNKCPMVATAKTLSPENAERLGIDRETCLNNLNALITTENLEQKLFQVYNSDYNKESLDPDHALYGGFISDNDRLICQQVHQTESNKLSELSELFSDLRLKSLLFRYRARNYPETLSDKEMHKWQEHRYFRFHDPASPASIRMEEFAMELERLTEEYQNDAKKIAIFKRLYQYVQQL